MNQTEKPYSTQNITPQLIAQIIEAIRNKAYGSIEIYIQDHNVVQITERTITKIGESNSQKSQNGFKKARLKVRITSSSDQSPMLAESGNP